MKYRKTSEPVSQLKDQGEGLYSWLRTEGQRLQMPTAGQTPAPAAATQGLQIISLGPGRGAGGVGADVGAAFGGQGGFPEIVRAGVLNHAAGAEAG